MKGHELVIGVTGGIAAYKTAALVSRLVQSGAGVSVIMSESATKFVGLAYLTSPAILWVRTSTWHDKHTFCALHLLLPTFSPRLPPVLPTTC